MSMRHPSFRGTGRGRRGLTIATVTAAFVLAGGVAAMAFVHAERHSRPTLTTAALPSSTSATASAAPPSSSTASAAPSRREAAPSRKEAVNVAPSAPTQPSAHRTTAPASGQPVNLVTSPANSTKPATSQAVPVTATTSPGSQQKTPYAELSVVTALSTSIHYPSGVSLEKPFSTTVTVAGGDGNYTWSKVDNLPPGLQATANGATLTISGTPTLLGEYGLYGIVSDGESTPQAASWGLFLQVIYPPITITVHASTQATVGVPYYGTITASGGPGNVPFTWSGLYGFPKGLNVTVNGATVTISGTPTKANLPASATPEPGRADVSILVSAGYSTASRDLPYTIYPAP